MYAQLLPLALPAPPGMGGGYGQPGPPPMGGMGMPPMPPPYGMPPMGSYWWCWRGESHTGCISFEQFEVNNRIIMRIGLCFCRVWIRFYRYILLVAVAEAFYFAAGSAARRVLLCIVYWNGGCIWYFSVLSSLGFVFSFIWFRFGLVCCRCVLWVCFLGFKVLKLTTNPTQMGVFRLGILGFVFSVGLIGFWVS